ncbi:hypothetical protein DL766_005154 [Monosporascus sp. MC13-8B]|uniref:N-acetyltransferase domain-containing protein n=1 Tax=Monosporascus cannonballus TaxID=155416 RepID=A0ABY0HIM3_9PEZI|nr:hypothetical protein DL763_005682 [Monosporascus cannonballus]RYO94306.1 hypothetical protein DL762_000630 [Monosporascus cannonballus]RYP29855.1 hypothetical protein DL766_005154 [Monosporascus sp. MC13-8B]
MALPFPPPASLSPSFIMAPPTEADVDAMTDVHLEAFEMDRRNTYWWSPDRAAQRAWMRRRIERKMREPGTRHFKIADVASGDLVAWARWNVPEGKETAFGVAVAAETGPTTATAEVTATAQTVTDYPEGAEPELCRSFFDALYSMAKKWDAKSMLGLSVLCTSPKYFKRGAAKALLTPMLEIADAEGLRTTLEATPTGKPLYEKLGFRQVDVLKFDLSQLTKDTVGIYDIAIMIREPKVKQ